MIQIQASTREKLERRIASTEASIRAMGRNIETIMRLCPSLTNEQTARLAGFQRKNRELHNIKLNLEAELAQAKEDERTRERALAS